MLGAKRQLLIIILIVFVGYLGISMPYLIFPALFINPSFSFLPPETSYAMRSILLGIALSAYPLGQFLGAPILGSLSDQKGRRLILVFSLFVTAISSLLTAFALFFNLLWLLIASRFLAGIMEGNVAISRAMAIEIKEIDKVKSLGLITANTSFAYLLGPIFGALLSPLGLPAPFLIISVIFFLLAIVAGTCLTYKAPFAVKRPSIVKRGIEIFSNRQLRLPLLLVTFFFLAVDIFYEFGPVHLAVNQMLMPHQLIGYNGILCLGLMAGSTLLPSYLSKKVDRSPLILSGILIFSAVTFLGAFTMNPWLIYLFFIVSGMAIGLASTLLTVSISDSVSEEMQGEIMGVQQSFRVLGDAFICLFGGLLLMLSSKLLLVAAATVAFLTACVGMRKSRIKEEGRP